MRRRLPFLCLLLFLAASRRLPQQENRQSEHRPAWISGNRPSDSADAAEIGCRRFRPAFSGNQHGSNSGWHTAYRSSTRRSTLATTGPEIRFEECWPSRSRLGVASRFQPERQCWGRLPMPHRVRVRLRRPCRSTCSKSWSATVGLQYRPTCWSSLPTNRAGSSPCHPVGPTRRRIPHQVVRVPGSSIHLGPGEMLAFQLAQAAIVETAVVAGPPSEDAPKDAEVRPGRDRPGPMIVHTDAAMRIDLAGGTLDIYPLYTP